MKTCTVEGCDLKTIARKMCSKHYYRWKRNGDPTKLRKIDTRYGFTVEDRFWHSIIKAPSGHWIWTGSVVSKEAHRDYGLFYTGERQMLAHRYAWEFLVGPIPEGLVIDHLCCFPRCVNPRHLQPVTQAVNMERGGVADHGIVLKPLIVRRNERSKWAS